MKLTVFNTFTLFALMSSLLAFALPTDFKADSRLIKRNKITFGDGSAAEGGDFTQAPNNSTIINFPGSDSAFYFFRFSFSFVYQVD